MKRSDTSNKHVDFSGLNTAGNILDYVCTQLNKTYNKGRHFNSGTVHIMSLKSFFCTSKSKFEILKIVTMVDAVLIWLMQTFEPHVSFNK